MRTLAHAVLIVILLAASAYAAVAPYPYRGALRHATHKGQAYDAYTWDAKVIWYATFFNDTFRTAFAQKHAKIHHMGPVEEAQWMEDQIYEQEREWEFFISMYTKRDYKKFSLDADTFWEIYLTTASGEVVWPTSIEHVPASPYEREMFNYVNRWSKCYRVTFPKIDLGHNVTLTLQSIVGSSSLLFMNTK